MNVANLYYSKDKSPIENLDTFFDAVKVPLYEWFELNDKSGYILLSLWNGAAGLKDITTNFQKDFCSHLIEISIDEKQTKDYNILLRECRARIQDINHYHKPSFNNVRIFTKVNAIEGELGTVKFESLPDFAQDTITRCHELFIVFYRQLDESITEEMKDYERSSYVMKASPFQWSGDKVELSEIALALFLSQRIKDREGKEINRTIFSRELAAFLGIHKLNLDQNIVSVMYNTHYSKTKFLDFLREKTEEYFAQRVDNQP